MNLRSQEESGKQFQKDVRSIYGTEDEEEEPTPEQEKKKKEEEKK